MGDLGALVLDRPDNESYSLFFIEDSVKVIYKRREISDFLRKGFAPLEGENVRDLEARLEEARKDREELLEDEEYSPVPEQYVREFEAVFGISIGDIVATHNDAKKRAVQGAKALYEGKYGEARVLNLAGTPDPGTVAHELIHAVMADNPTMVELESEPGDKSNRFYSMMDIFYLPLPYSPYDRRFAVLEAAPAALLNEKENVLSSSLAPVANGLWGYAGQAALATIVSCVSRKAGKYMVGLWLGSGAARVPRLAYATVKSIKMYSRVSEMKERLGKQETLKLLTFADDKMMEQIANYIKQEDIRF